jgi:hypothetical protein
VAADDGDSTGSSRAGGYWPRPTGEVATGWARAMRLTRAQAATASADDQGRNASTATDRLMFLTRSRSWSLRGRRRPRPTLGERALSTNQLAAQLYDVPAGSLYRHIPADQGRVDVLQVVGACRVRGAVERTYTLRLYAAAIGPAESAAMTGAQVSHALRAYIAGLLTDVDHYLVAAPPTPPGTAPTTGWGPFRHAQPESSRAHPQPVVGEPHPDWRRRQLRRSRVLDLDVVAHDVSAQSYRLLAPLLADVSNQARAASTSERICSGVTVGSYLEMTVPSRSTRNLVKFHLTSSVPIASGRLFCTCS